MKDRTLSIIVCGLLIGCTSSGANWQPYRISAMAEAQGRGMVVYLHVDDPKDPVCEQQKELLQELTRGEKYKNAAAFRVAFGTEKLLESDHRIKEACQLLVFKGERLYTRVGRDADKKRLKSAISQAL